MRPLSIVSKAETLGFVVPSGAHFLFCKKAAVRLKGESQINGGHDEKCSEIAFFIPGENHLSCVLCYHGNVSPEQFTARSIKDIRIIVIFLSNFYFHSICVRDILAVYCICWRKT